MVCSAEVSRMNGAKSRGAVTERGKAIASHNAVKHGLLAQKPPLLVTEDLSNFETLVQGLIDYYQPENPALAFLDPADCNGNARAVSAVECRSRDR